MPTAVDRLDLKHRADLQIELIRQMLGDNPSPEDELNWVKEYGKKVSDLIDYHEHDDIRDLALKGDYSSAVELILDLLEVK